MFRRTRRTLRQRGGNGEDKGDSQSSQTGSSQHGHGHGTRYAKHKAEFAAIAAKLAEEDSKQKAEARAAAAAASSSNAAGGNGGGSTSAEEAAAPTTETAVTSDSNAAGGNGGGSTSAEEAAAAATTSSSNAAGGGGGSTDAATVPEVTSEGLCAWRTDESKKTAALAIWRSKLTNEPLVFLATGKSITQAQHDIVVEYQDELFGMAMGIIYEQLGIGPEDDESAILAKYKNADEAESLRNYIEDIARLIFKKGVVTLTSSAESDNRHSTSKTKVERLIYSTLKVKDSLPEILLNPERVKNQFIYWLAAFISHQKKNSELLNNIKDTETVAETVAILANRYDSLVKANTLNVTTKELRDGMDLTMTGDTANSLYTSFWKCFLLRCTNQYYKTFESIELYEPTYNIQMFRTVQSTIQRNTSNKNIVADDYAFIAAAIYDSILTPFKIHPLVTGLQETGDAPYRQFGLHLTHVLREMTNSQESGGPAAQTSQPRTNESPSVHQGLVEAHTGAHTQPETQSQ
jgi:hypothetical protein